MVITASYGLNENVILTTAEVTGYKVSPTPLTDGITYVTISYSEMGVTRTTTQLVTVTHRLTAIEITQEPATLVYEYGDTLQIAGMVVQATYSDGQQVNVSGYQHSPSALNTVGQQTITVTYSENGITEQDTFQVTVNRMSVAKPTWKGSLTYNGSNQSVTSTSYWNNYNTTYMSIGGTTSATNAGTYTATFTLGSNYRWNDGTTDAEEVEWSIAKAAGSLRLSQNSVAISTDNYSSGVNVNITRAGDGVISYTPTSVNGLTITLNGTTLNIRGNGSTAVSTTITVKVAEGTNYLAPGNQNITVTAIYWDWGNDGDTVNEAWFEGLHNYLQSNSANSSWIGDTKRVTLSSAVLGTTTHLIRCIDVNKDATRSVTFQTANMLNDYLPNGFGSSATWNNSYAKNYCEQYYNAFPGRAYIATIRKGTNTSYNSSSISYTNETVFIPSIHEMGLASYNYAPDTGEYTQGVNSSYAYYTSDSTRIKKKGDNGSADYYWTRSRSTYYSVSVCYVNYDGTANYGHYSRSGIGLAPALVIS